jgi:hypothetical protein
MGHSLTGKKLFANLACFAVLLTYTLFGGLIFLYFERDHSLAQKQEVLERRHKCIQELLRFGPKSGAFGNNHYELLLLKVI